MVPSSRGFAKPQAMLDTVLLNPVFKHLPRQGLPLCSTSRNFSDCPIGATLRIFLNEIYQQEQVSMTGENTNNDTPISIARPSAPTCDATELVDQRMKQITLVKIDPESL